MVRSPCCHNDKLKKGPWTPEEDEKLIGYINRHGHGSWKALPKHAGLNRCGKSCRLRWTNYLRPDIKRGKFSEEEERLIINLHSVLGNKCEMLFFLMLFLLKNCKSWLIIGFEICVTISIYMVLQVVKDCYASSRAD